MKELVVVSGKGGTGKTTVVASFAALAQRKVMVDCDVDAADLHLILAPEVRREEPFSSGMTAEIVPDKCTACDRCRELCRFEAVRVEDGRYRIDPLACEGCGVCVRFCPEGAIVSHRPVCGHWFVSETRHGPMVHARLGIAEENSGKLVSLVRREAREIATERDFDLIIADGSPGIGCPVIASIAGADLLLAVTEPTRSGLHDLQRVHALARHFNLPVLICINKHDLNADIAADIERWAAEAGTEVVGRIGYDPVVTRAQVEGKSVVEFTDAPAAMEIRDLWRRVSEALAAQMD